MSQFSVRPDPTYDYQAKVFCIISDQRVFRSKSPSIFTQVLKRVGINGSYVPFMVREGDIGKALESMKVLNIAGANVTAPFKEKVTAFMDVLSEGANIIGAVNTIVCKDGRLKGYNTNAIGIMDALNEIGFDVAGKKALVVGTGGAARAVVFILNWLRAESIVVAGRNMGKATCLADHFGCTARPLDSLAEASGPVDIIVNATPVSSKEDSSDVTEIVRSLKCKDCQLVYDLNYERRNNIWQSLAEENHIRFQDGLPALVYQARRTFLLWTGRDVRQEEFLNAMSG